MMLFALVLSGLLLAFAAFAAFAAFGLPCMVMGARAFEEFGGRPDAQAMAGVLAALPFVAPALISPGPQVQVFTETVLGAASPFRS